IRQTDYDWWWHLRTGQLIWEQRAIPTADPYSFTNAGRPWVVHEWLFEVLTYLGYRAIGYSGLSLALGLVLLATFTLHYLLLRALGARPRRGRAGARDRGHRGQPHVPEDLPLPAGLHRPRQRDGAVHPGVAAAELPRLLRLRLRADRAAAGAAGAAAAALRLHAG